MTNRGQIDNNVPNLALYVIFIKSKKNISFNLILEMKDFECKFYLGFIGEGESRKSIGGCHDILLCERGPYPNRTSKTVVVG